MPTYIAFYVIVPRAIGGRLYSDVMARLSFALFLVFAMHIGIHHLFADPGHFHLIFAGAVVIMDRC
jgi:cytochrome c oxidase subunit 1